MLKLHVASDGTDGAGHSKIGHVGPEAAPAGTAEESFVQEPGEAETAAAAQRTGIAVTHLLCVAALLHSPPADAGLPLGTWQLGAAAGMLACSAAMILIVQGRRTTRFRLAVLPMLAVPARDVTRRLTWLPGLGWRVIDDGLREELRRRASVPMVAIALLVLPLLAVEHFFEEAIKSSNWLTAATTLASLLVWAAFTLEFLIGCTLSHRRLAYCKTQWLDLAIIVLPLVAFLRAARLGRLVYLQESARVFRLRGVAMKVWQAVILFDLIGRLVRRTPEKQRAYLLRRRDELTREVDEIEAELMALQSRDELRAA